MQKESFTDKYPAKSYKKSPMITWIGLCAGEIWQYLDKHQGEASLQALLSEIDAPKETVFMALGWLGREAHILIEGELPDFRVKLNGMPTMK